MRDSWKMVLSVLVFALLAVFVVETFLFFKYGYLLPVKNLLRLIIGK